MGETVGDLVSARKGFDITALDTRVGQARGSLTRKLEPVGRI